MKRKFLFLFFIFLVLPIGLFFCWKFYQNTTREIISVDDITEVRLEKQGNDLYMIGQAELKYFEKISNYGAVQIDDILYIYVIKMKSLTNEDSFNLNISAMTVSDSLDEPQNIYLVSGEDIVVKDPNDSKRDHIEVTNYSNKIELFPDR
ncbi:hypothetical protein [Enterococcus lemanii]|uniref:Lipoprotein n=1 Tax=Enterococcus lemanii TaxID=1159752 RepID=A0ABV9MV06_9ENTE|nr:hypothetical protein [Enterococcus lemanii]MBM7710435.1 hypothetical protein [Enterococcus lemanii]